MYGKIDADGKFIPAPVKKSTVEQANKTIIEYYTPEELKAMDYKEVYSAEGTGRPGPGLRPEATFEDKGDFILRRTNWVAVK